MTYLHVDIIWALWNNGPVIFLSWFPASPLNGNEQDGIVKRSRDSQADFKDSRHSSSTRWCQWNIGLWPSFLSVTWVGVGHTKGQELYFLCFLAHTDLNEWFLSKHGRKEGGGQPCPRNWREGESPPGCLVVGVVLVVLVQAGHGFLHGGKVFFSSRLRYHNSKK